MDFEEIHRRAVAFAADLRAVKASTEPPTVGWYPPMLPGHIENLDRLLVGESRRLLEQPPKGRIADLGAADGDLGFFLETLGFDVDLYDGANRPRMLKEPLGSAAEIHFVDLDHDFELPRQYDLVFLLHVVYHLRNPMLALDTLARFTPYCILSTRTANLLPRTGRGRRHTSVEAAPVAYLLDPFELSRTDAHNYWIFSQRGLLRLVDRCGWDVEHHLAVGNPKATSSDLDQPVVWCLLRSRTFAQQ